MSNEESDTIAAIAVQLWRSEKQPASQLAELVMKQNPIPPIVASLQGMDRFLADLQRRSFLHGASAALAYANALGELEVVKAALRSETTGKPN